MPLYAQAGVPEVWTVDLNARKVQWFRRPDAGRYTEAGDLDLARPVPLPAEIGGTIDLANLI